MRPMVRKMLMVLHGISAIITVVRGLRERDLSVR